MGCRDCSPSSSWVVTPPGQPRVSASPPPALWHCRLAGRLAAREADPVPQPPGRRVSLPGPAPALPARPGAKGNTPSAWGGSSGGGKRSLCPTLCPPKGRRRRPAEARVSGMSQLRRGAHQNRREQRFASCSGLGGTSGYAGSILPALAGSLEPRAPPLRRNLEWSTRGRSVRVYPSHAAFRERLVSEAGRGGALSTRSC